MTNSIHSNPKSFDHAAPSSEDCLATAPSDDPDAAFGVIIDPPTLRVLADEREAGERYRDAFPQELDS